MASFIGSQNTFIASHEASGKLAIHYSRNVKDFPLNRYITMTPVKFSSGYYLRITPENAARILAANLNRHVWADGADRPKGSWNHERFTFVSFTTERVDFPFQLGYKGVEQASWQILAQYSAMAAQQAMTARTRKVLEVALTSGNYPSAHTSTAAALVGGTLDSGTPQDPVLKEAINAVKRQILLSSLGAVKGKEIQMVIGPEMADRLGRSEEVHAYLKESPAALAQVRGDVPSQNGEWGLPDFIYGTPLVVEDTVIVTEKPNADDTAAITTRLALDIATENKVLFAARPGSLVSAAGGPNFSSIHMFAYEEMSVESKDDKDNRRHEGHVIEDYSVALVSPISGYLITSAF